MAEKRTFSVVTLTIENEEEFLDYLGFDTDDITSNPDGSADCEISHAGYRADALSTGSGHVVAQIGPVSPKDVNGIRPDVTIEIRNGHNLAADGITVNPPEKYVVTAVTLRGKNYEYPEGDVVNAAMKAIRESVSHLHAHASQFRQTSRMAHAMRNRRPGPR